MRKVHVVYSAKGWAETFCGLARGIHEPATVISWALKNREQICEECWEQIPIALRKRVLGPGVEAAKERLLKDN